jgi:hypothetical protein
MFEFNFDAEPGRKSLYAGNYRAVAPIKGLR